MTPQKRNGPEPQTQQGVFARLAAKGFRIEHSASYDIQDGAVCRIERIHVWHPRGIGVRGAGATFDEAFLDLAQKIIEASTHLMDVASVVQETITTATFDPELESEETAA